MKSSLLGAAKRFIGKQVFPQGQVQWTVPGTYQWVCPPGVKSVSALVIAAGGEGGVSGSSPMSGAGGGLRWKNNIPVVPGQTYTVVVGTGGVTLSPGTRGPNTNAAESSVLGLMAGLYATGTPLGNGVGGGWGGGGGSWQAGGNKVATGGYAGRYTNGNTPSRSGANDGDGVKGTQLTVDDFAATIDFGGGGNGIYNFTSTPYSYAGGKGAVRLIWGKDRGYPATKIDNQPVIT